MKTRFTLQGESDIIAEVAETVLKALTEKGYKYRQWDTNPVLGNERAITIEAYKEDGQV